MGSLAAPSRAGSLSPGESGHLAEEGRALEERDHQWRGGVYPAKDGTVERGGETKHTAPGNRGANGQGLGRGTQEAETLPGSVTRTAPGT